MVDSVVYTFNQAVTLEPNAVRIALQPNVTINSTPNQTVGTLPTLSWASPDGGTTWVVTFSGSGVSAGSIADGVYDITLDGMWVASQSTGVTVVTTRTDTFYRLFGDSNGDKKVDTTDSTAYSGTSGISNGGAGYLAYFDSNDDGTVDAASTDYTAFTSRSGTTWTAFTSGATSSVPANSFSETIDPLGNITTVVNDLAGNEVESIDALGNIARMTYDQAGQMLTSTDALGHTTSYAYDQDGRQVSTTDALSNITTTVYDLAGTPGAPTVSSVAVNAGTVAIVSASESGTTVTVTTNGSHGFTTGQHVLITGVSVAGYNGAFTIASAPTANTFTYTAAASLGSATGGLATDASSSGTALSGSQRSMVDSVVYTFNQAVTLEPNAVRIALQPDITINGTPNQIAGTLPTLSWASPDGGTHWVVTFSDSGVSASSIADGVYDITLDGMWIVNSSGQTVDTTRTDTFYRLFGDSNGDKKVDTTDSTAYSGSSGVSNGSAGYLAYFDYNDDGTVDASSTDHTAFTSRSSTTWTAFTSGASSSVVANTFTATIDPRGNITTVVNDTAGRQIETVDALGAFTTMTYDPAGQMLTSVDAMGHTTSYAYDADGRETSVTDPLSNTTTTVYDLAGTPSAPTVSSMTVNGGTVAIVGATESGTTVTVTTNGINGFSAYDIVLITGMSVAGYNGVFTIASVPTANTFTFTTSSGLANASGGTATDTASSGTALSGTQRSMVDSLVYTFDQAVTIEPNALRIALHPDVTINSTPNQAVGTLPTLSWASPDGGITWVVTFSGSGVSASSIADGVYDITLDGMWVVNASGQTIDTTQTNTFYRLFGDYNADMAVDSTDSTQYATSSGVSNGCAGYLAYFDSNDNGAVDASGTDYTAFTSRSGTTWTNFSEGSSSVVANTFVATVDALNNITTQVFDTAGRQVATVDALGNFTTMSYDAVGNNTGVLDADGNQTTFVFDNDNRVVNKIDPDGTTTYVYDVDSRLTKTIDQLGQTVSVTYDADSRETGEKWYNAGNTLSNTLTYTYDAVGNMLTAADSHGAYTFTYDADNRMASQQDMFGTTNTYTYDAAGNLTKIVDSLGGTQTMVYDADNRQTTVEFSGNSQTLNEGIVYNANGQASSVSRYSNVAGTSLVGSTSYTYDADNQVTNIHHLNSAGSNITNITYTHDAAGEITTQNRDSSLSTYTYDTTGQLLTDSSATYAYDANGNRDNGGFTVGTNNQVITDGTWTYTYDAAGEITQKSMGASSTTWNYTYDERHQMTSAIEHATPGGTILATATYDYDVFGDLITEAVTVSAVTTTTNTAFRILTPTPGIVASVNQAYADLDSGHALLLRFIFNNLSMSPIARLNSGAFAWLLTDELGSAVVVTDGSGSVLATAKYEGFGNIIASTGTSANLGVILFAGYRIDPETGLLGAHWRWYNPSTGQWTTVDPLGFGGGDTNTRRYVENKAISKTDKSGLEPELGPSPRLQSKYSLEAKTVWDDGFGGTWYYLRDFRILGGSPTGVILQEVRMTATGGGIAKLPPIPRYYEWWGVRADDQPEAKYKFPVFAKDGGQEIQMRANDGFTNYVPARTAGSVTINAKAWFIQYDSALFPDEDKIKTIHTTLKTISAMGTTPFLNLSPFLQSDQTGAGQIPSVAWSPAAQKIVEQLMTRNPTTAPLITSQTFSWPTPQKTDRTEKN